MAHNARMGLIGRRTRGMVGMLLVAVALLAGASDAQAAGGPLEPGRYRDAYESASLSSVAPDANGRYIGSTVSLFRTDAGTHLCVDNVEQSIDGGLIVNSGCAPMAASTLQLDKQLSGVTLAPTWVPVIQSKCDFVSEHEVTCTELGTHTLKVAATIEGVGDVQQTRSRSSYNDGTYTYKFRGSGSYRMANGSVTVNDEAQSGTGSLSTAKQLMVVRAN